MINKVIVLLVFSVLNCSLAFASEKIPIPITPSQVISTDHDEVEYGDVLEFKVTKDVYKENQLLIKKDAPVEAEVDYVSPNGWVADTAYIQFKHFKIQTANNHWIDIPYTLKIKGTDCLKSSNPFYKSCIFASYIVRGPEVYLEPSQRNFNIFLIY